MDNKFKKSKYAALVLASTLALSTVASVAPQAFGETSITALAATVSEGDTYTSGTATDKKATIEIADVQYEVTLAAEKATLTLGKNKTLEIKANDYVTIDGLNLQATTVSETSLVLTVLEQQTPGNVTELINDLDITESTYKEDVAAAKAAYALLTEADKTKVKNKAVLTAHEKFATDNDATYKLVTELPDSVDIQSYKKYTTETITGKPDAVTEKGKSRVINNDLEDAVAAIKAFNTAYATLTKDEKKALSTASSLAKDLLKEATAQQKVVAASAGTEIFDSAYKALTKGEAYTPVANIYTVKSNKFKIGDDTYTILKDGDTTTVTSESVEYAVTDGKFTIKDADVKQGGGEEDAATASGTYVISSDGTTVTQETSKIELNKAVPILKFDSKMSVSAYKTLKTGTKKYSANQIALIEAVSAAYKGLDATGKKSVSKAQQTKIKKYEKALKAQQALEKKLVVQDSSGVTKKITALKYNETTYEEEIQAARTAYDALTNKYKKKVKKATVSKLKDHEAAIEVIKLINNLPTENLLLAKTDDTDSTTTGLKVLSDKIAAVKENLDKTKPAYGNLTKAQQALVKNYKTVASLEKQITSQTTYLTKTNYDLIAAWKTAFAKIAGTEDVQVLNNQFAIGTDIYTLSYDKTAKTTSLTVDGKAVDILENGKDTATSTLPDPAKGSAVGFFPGADASYKITSTKGKFKVDKVTATDDAPALEVLTFTSTTNISATDTKLYTTQQVTDITAAKTAYTAAAAVKDAKGFLNKDDVTIYNSYVKALTSQQALELKAKAAAKTLLTSEKEISVENGKATDTTAVLAAIKALDEASVKNKFIKDLVAADLTIDNGKVTVKFSDTISAELKIKELPSAAETAAKTALTGKTVTVAADKVTDKTTVLAAIKALDTSSNTVIAALTDTNITITSGKVKVVLPSGDSVEITVTAAS